MRIRSAINTLGLIVLFSCGSLPAHADRIKDLANIAGVRSNPLIGYGLIVGLDGTGDQVSQTPFTVQSLRSMLQRFGISIPANVNPQPKNIAAVVLHADLPAFAKPGHQVDVTVSSIGNAKSLRGGSLLMTPLKGIDGKVYAIAQGNLVVAGFGAEAKDGSSITVNVPSVGRIPRGATIERLAPTPFGGGRALVFNLNTPDFTTAKRMVDTINAVLGHGTAIPIDAASIRVKAPAAPDKHVGYISMLENLSLEPGEAPARIVINSRTGTVVIGRHVRVMPAAVSHGSLTVTITNEPVISQPGPLSLGETVVETKSDIEITEKGTKMFLLNPGTSLDEIVRAVNEVGAAPGDLVAILEALKAAGALRAELVVI